MRVSRRLFSCAEWGAPGIAGAGCQPGEIAIPPLGQTDTSGLNRGIDRVILPLRTGRNHSAQQSDHGRQLAHGYEADGQGSAENRTQEAPHACPHSSPQRLIVGADFPGDRPQGWIAGVFWNTSPARNSPPGFLHALKCRLVSFDRQTTASRGSAERLPATDQNDYAVRNAPRLADVADSVTVDTA
jgi:hypothetical protein